jgi:bleomycin hydrolase
MTRPGSLLVRCFALSALAIGLATPAQAQTMQEQVREALEKLPHPRDVGECQFVPSLPCLNQSNTLICWSFATCSFLESEMTRLNLPSVRLSVMYPSYCQYVEKARRFVQTKGDSRFSPGDTFCGVPDACRQYGAMPASVYDGPPGGRAFNQRQLYAELEEYMQQVKVRGQWDEPRVLSKVKELLNRHLGEPPKTFSYNGKDYTPKSFLADVVRLPWADYVILTSFESTPFNTFMELKIPDNWRHNTNFLNVPLPVFYDAFKGALRAGFTVAVEMDNTEPSYQTTGRYCFIPDFDIPAPNITQAAREIRFVSGATDDDHAIHILGWANVGGEDWFLAKDSGKGAWRNGNQGCLFLHSSYVKLKVLAFIVHHDGVPQVKALLPPR